MRIFLLKRKDYAKYEETRAYVVRAVDESDARRLATELSVKVDGCENTFSSEIEFKDSSIEAKKCWDDWKAGFTTEDVLYSPWEDVAASTCDELTHDGERGLILRDYMEP